MTTIKIASGTNPVSNPGGIVVEAANNLTSDDLVTLATGGVVQGAGVTSTINATLTNSATIGSNDSLTSNGNIGVGTYTTATAETNAEGYTYGLAAVGIANATTSIVSKQTVSVGGGTTMTAFGNVNLAAGNDPTGQNSTLLSGTSNAQAYTEGLAGIPSATPTTSITDKTCLTINSGSQIESGLNVTLGAFPGSPNASEVGATRYAVLGIPETNNFSSSPATTTSSSVTQDGTITAGIYHQLTITIPDDDSAGSGFSKTINISPDGPSNLPLTFSSAFNNSFDAPSFIDGLGISQTDEQLLDSGVSSTPVGAFTLGTLYASGGTVAVDGTVQASSGTITAYGAPTISVTNSSPDYLVLGAIDIPNSPGGEVIVNGTTLTNSQFDGITISQINAGQKPSVTIDQTYVGPVGNSPYGPALFVTGTIENLGGTVSITNQDGSFGEAATIYGYQVHVYTPQGATVIAISNGSYYAGGNPYSEWNSYMVWPGGNPSGTLSPIEAVPYAANAIYNPDDYLDTYFPAITALSLFNQILYGYAGETPAPGTSEVFIGDSVPFDSTANDGKSANETLTNQASGGDLEGAYAMSSSDGNGNQGYLPFISTEPTPTPATSYSSADLTGSQNSSSMYASLVAITAQTIDIDGQITAGQPQNWSVNLSASLGSILQTYQQGYIQGTNTSAEFDIPATDLSVVNTGDFQISATYNAATNQILLDNVNSSFSAGNVSLNGAIISSNPDGMIQFNADSGTVNVNNQTGIPLVVQNISAGSNSATSQVDITDTNKTSSSEQTLYVYQNGTIKQYQGAAGANLGTGTPLFIQYGDLGQLRSRERFALAVGAVGQPQPHGECHLWFRWLGHVFDHELAVQYLAQRPEPLALRSGPRRGRCDGAPCEHRHR